MSGLDVPSWKQELLKRKKANLTPEKLLSGQNVSNTKHRVGYSGNIKSNVLINHRLADSEKKTNHDNLYQNALGRNKNESVLNSERGNSNTRNVYLGVDIDRTNKSQTIQANLGSNILSVDSGPSRLDSFDKKPTRTGIYNNKIAGSNVRGMQQNTRGYMNKEKLTEVSDDGITEFKESEIGEGVDCEHIVPKDVKKMWQQQAIKDEALPKNHPKNLGSVKEVPRGIHVNHQEISKWNNTQVASKLPSAPKAYKSPYAKSQWHRPVSFIDKKLVINQNVGLEDTKNVKSHFINSSSSKCGNSIDNENKYSEGEVEHIQSVKSLLGLFDGKAKSPLNRKVSDNVLFGSKTAKGKNSPTSEFKSFSNKKPGLFKHHSEPNLFFSSDNKSINLMPLSPKVSPTSPIKFQTIKVASDDAALPMHQVSQGIQDRMTRLHRASHSDIEEIEGFNEYEVTKELQKINIATCDESHINQKQSPRLRDISNRWSSNRLEKNDQATVLKQNSLGNDRQPKNDSSLDDSTFLSVKTSVGQKNENLHKVKSASHQSDNVKPRLSYSAHLDSRLTSPVSSIPQHQCKSTITNNELKTKLPEEGLPKQTSDLLQPEYGPIITSNTTGWLDMSEHKSENKYQNKQNNYVLQSSQSDFNLHNNVVSTECLTEIKQSKQEETKPFTKNTKPFKDDEGKLDKKPRRKGLNVVDPSAVLQLTKDPILLKEKPATEELGVFKESSSGKVQIIKHQPDKKNQIAQINHTWDLDNKKPALEQNIPASTLHVPSRHQKNVPVTTIDEVPVSSIDDFNMAGKQKFEKNYDDLKADNSTLYNKTLTNGDVETTSSESEKEFIPVSSIDDDADLGPPPEIVFDTIPGSYKSSFMERKGKKRGKISFFEHVFIHDYQSESAAASDWDYENGAAFSSYTPAALKQLKEGSNTYNFEPTSSPQPVSQPTTQVDSHNDEPLITYNEEESLDFSGSSDSTAGAMLF